MPCFSFMFGRLLFSARKLCIMGSFMGRVVYACRLCVLMREGDIRDDGLKV